jgi:hypothetical protein
MQDFCIRHCRCVVLVNDYRHSPPTSGVRKFGFLFTLPGREVQDRDAKIVDFEHLLLGDARDGVIRCSIGNCKQAGDMMPAEFFTFFEVRILLPTTIESATYFSVLHHAPLLPCRLSVDVLFADQSNDAVPVGLFCWTGTH